MGHRLTIVLVAVVVAAALGSDEGPDPARELCRVAPMLQAEIARHVVHDGETEFRSFCASVGSLRLRIACQRLMEAMEQDSLEDYRRVADLVLPHAERIGRGLDEEYGIPSALRDVRFRRSLDPARGFALQRLIREQRDVEAQGNLEPGEHLRRYRLLHEQYRSMGYERGLMFVERNMEYAYRKLGNPRRAERAARSAIGRARRLGDIVMLCQTLGELGYYEKTVDGAVDSARAHYDEACRLALKHRLPDQAGRLIEFESNRQAREGRLALAMETAFRAQRVCRELLGGGAEVRFVFAAIRRFAELGCWDAAEQQLARCPPLLRQLDYMQGYVVPWGRDVELTRARALLARGRVDSARVIYSKHRDDVHATGSRGKYSSFLLDWTDGLLEAGAPAEALTLAEEALTYCDSLHVTEMVPDLAMSKARALAELGRSAEAAGALALADAAAAHQAVQDRNDLALARQVLRLRLLQTQGESPAVREAAARAWSDLRSFARRLDAGPQ